jgi:hypothetical protein
MLRATDLGFRSCERPLPEVVGEKHLDLQRKCSVMSPHHRVLAYGVLQSDVSQGRRQDPDPE